MNSTNITLWTYLDLEIVKGLNVDVNSIAIQKYKISKIQQEDHSRCLSYIHSKLCGVGLVGSEILRISTIVSKNPPDVKQIILGSGRL